MTKLAQHTPWNEMTNEQKNAQASTIGRPIRWTLEPGLVGTVAEDGHVFVYAGGIIGEPPKKPKVRADGKIDGRSKGLRKCGKCGESGHNARTCGARAAKADQRARFASLMSKPIPAPGTPSGELIEDAPQTTQEASKVVPAPKRMTGAAPVPKTILDRARGSKTCSVCGKVGHNARTCGKQGSRPGVKKGPKPCVEGPGKARKAAVKVRGGSGSSKAAKGAVRQPGSGKTGRLNKCGKCGGMGHNARSCGK